MRPDRLPKALAVLAACLMSSATSWASECQLRAPAQWMGIGTHARHLKSLPQTMEKIAAAGFNSVRDEAMWVHVEDGAGNLKMTAEIDAWVDAALAAGLEPLLILDYGHPRYDGGDKPLSAEARAGFRRYARFVVNHFRGKVRHFQIWNEWDIAIGGTRPGTAEDFARFVTDVATYLRAENPSLCLIAGGVVAASLDNGWFDRALGAGLATAVDALAVHPYNFSNTGERNSPEAWLAQMRKVIHRLKREPGPAKPVYITEMGWPTHLGRFGVRDEVQGNFAQRLWLLARTLPEVAGIWWYGWRDDGPNPFEKEHRFGLVTQDEKPKAGYRATAELLPELASLPKGRALRAGHGLNVLLFPSRGPGTGPVLALWNSLETDDALAITADRAVPGPDGWRARTRGCRVRATGAQASLALDATPCLLTLQAGLTAQLHGNQLRLVESTDGR